jgi:hypothetical protein
MNLALCGKWSEFAQNARNWARIVRNATGSVL